MKKDAIDTKCDECHKVEAEEGSGYCAKCAKMLDEKYRILAEHRKELESGAFMNRVRASRAYINNHPSNNPDYINQMEVFAFIHLFHPEKILSRYDIGQAVRKVGRQ